MSLLITRPRYDLPTHYLYHWSEKMISEAKRKDLDFYDIKKEKVTKKIVSSYLKKNNPEIVIFNGHGNQNTITGHENEELITVNNNSHLLKNSRIFMRSCECGKKLGPDMIKKGANGFVGYMEPFVLLTDPRKFSTPLKDKIAKPYLECSNQVGISLIKGHTAKEAHELSLKIYKRKINDMHTSASNPSLIWALQWNMDSQVYEEKNDLS